MGKEGRAHRTRKAKTDPESVAPAPYRGPRVPLRWRCFFCATFRAFYCDGDGSEYLVRIDGIDYCAKAWIAKGRPGRIGSYNPIEAARREEETRRRMLKRGGTAAHLVRKGLT